MSTNSADPSRLQGFARSLDGPAAAASAAFEAVAWSLARYQTDCADFPVDTSAPTTAADAVGLVHDLSAGTKRVASAFVLADAGRGPDGVRRVDADRLAQTLAAVSAVANRFGGEMDFEHGIVTDSDASCSLGPDGLTAEMVGSILVGARFTGSAEQELGPIRVRQDAEAMVGAILEGEASLTIGPDGLSGHVSGEAFVGGKVTGSAQLDTDIVDAEAEATFAAGHGLEGELGLEASWDNVEVEASFLAALGFGGGLRTRVSFDPSGLRDTYEWTEDRVGDAYEWSEDRVEDTYEWTEDRVGEAYDIGKGIYHGGLDTVDGLVNVSRDPAGALREVFGGGTAELDWSKVAELVEASENGESGGACYYQP